MIMVLALGAATAMTTAARPALADDWQPYANGRFGYAVDLPPGFNVTNEADNGDGLTLRSADGTAELLVFGSTILDGSFADEADGRIASAEEDGWALSYKRVLGSAASWSGTRKNEILYARGVTLCDGSAGYFQIEYRKVDRKRYDAIVKRLVKSLHPAEGCAGKAVAPPPG